MTADMLPVRSLNCTVPVKFQVNINNLPTLRFTRKTEHLRLVQFGTSYSMLGAISNLTKPLLGSQFPRDY